MNNILVSNSYKVCALLIVLSLFIANACTYRLKDEQLPDEVCTVPLPDTVSFSKDIQPILQNNCSTSGCHSGANPAGNFNLEENKAYAQLTKNGSGYVDTINPRNSVVYSSLVSKTQPMPPTGKLDQCSIDKIEKWMKQKAKNN